MGEKKTHFGYSLVPEEEKQRRVNQVFHSVAEKYDLMNDLMSLGIHRLWKQEVAKKTGLRPGQSAIDVAGGTADIAILLARLVGTEGRVVVYDINHDMLELGRRKCIDAGIVKGVEFVQGDAECISFPDNTFHCATIGFGIRNVTHIEQALREMHRVIKPGGRVLCLEFSHPQNRLLKGLYDLYSFTVIPLLGEVVTGNRSAYTYLAESIRKFPAQEEFKAMMESAGLKRVRYYNLFNGIAAIHMGVKI